jgi:hypothetical protein
LVTSTPQIGHWNEYVDIDVVTHSCTCTLLIPSSTSPQVGQVALTIATLLFLLRDRPLFTFR